MTDSTDRKEAILLFIKARGQATLGEVAVIMRRHGTLLAANIHRYRADPFDLGIGSKPLRITLYDLAIKSEKCSIGIRHDAFYAVSPEETVAVTQGNVLSLYRP